MTTTTDTPVTDKDTSDYDIYPAMLGETGPSLKERLFSDFNYPKMHCVIGKFEVALAETIPYFMDSNTKILLGWVLENVHQMRGQLTWGRHSGDPHDLKGVLPDSSIAYMRAAVERTKVDLEAHAWKQPKIQWEHPDLWKMEYLYQEVAEVNLYCRRWSVRGHNEDFAAAGKELAKFTSALLEYLYWAMRSEYKARGYVEKDTSLYVTPFPL
jgi:hypothetical protein